MNKRQLTVKEIRELRKDREAAYIAAFGAPTNLDQQDSMESILREIEENPHREKELLQRNINAFAPEELDEELEFFLGQREDFPQPPPNFSLNDICGPFSSAQPEMINNPNKIIFQPNIPPPPLPAEFSTPKLLHSVNFTVPPPKLPQTLISSLPSTGQLPVDRPIMNTKTQLLYKKLAEIKMTIPIIKPDSFSQDQWEEFQDLYRNANFSLDVDLTSVPEMDLYTEKFNHFIHLSFADEKLDLESKFKENATVRYLRHRGTTTNKRANKRKFVQNYGVYEFSLNDCLDELVLYGKVVIADKSGTITHINKEEHTIEVSFEDEKGEILFDEAKSYTIDITYNERQYKSYLRSIYLLEEGRGTAVIYPDTKDLISYEDYQRQYCWYQKNVSHQVANQFDEKQCQAIFSIVEGIHGSVPFVLWGPPGTGKTVTIVECVRQLLLKDSTNRILICTPSNSAADLVARRIYESGNIPASQMRRYYSLGKSTNDRDRELDPIIKMENCMYFGLSDDRFKIDKYKDLVRQNVRLIFSTLVCSAYLEEYITEPDFFTHIFIDEASQSFEPETLIPITRFATERTRIILCGDYEQLGAVVKAHFLKRYKQTCFSLMERLMRTMSETVYTDERTFCKLTDSYRCHPRIIEFSSTNFYAGDLRAVNELNRRAFCDWKYLPKKNFPVIFHVVSRGAEIKQTDGGRSFHNQEEVEVVLKYIQLIKNTMGHIQDQDIGVISPYRQQTQKIRARLGHRRDITVDSVECFQGSERRVIIMSLARSEQLGFLSEYKSLDSSVILRYETRNETQRMNTSFTRAKELLIVIASLAFINVLHPNNPKRHWETFIRFCMDNDAITIDKFAGEDGGELSKEEINEFKRRIEEGIQNEPGEKIERGEPRKKRPEVGSFEEKTEADVEGWGCDSSDEISKRNTNPVRKLQSLHPTPLFKKPEDLLSYERSAPFSNGQIAFVNNNESTGRLSSDEDDDEAGTEFWAKHFCGCPPSNRRPFKSQSSYNGGGFKEGFLNGTSIKQTNTISPFAKMQNFDNEAANKKNESALSDDIVRSQSRLSNVNDNIVKPKFNISNQNNKPVKPASVANSRMPTSEGVGSGTSNPLRKAGTINRAQQPVALDHIEIHRPIRVDNIPSTTSQNDSLSGEIGEDVASGRSEVRQRNNDKKTDKRNCEIM